MNVSLMFVFSGDFLFETVLLANSNIFLLASELLFCCMNNCKVILLFVMW